MTPQQHADRLLLLWQGNRHLPPERRLPEIVAPRLAADADPCVVAQMDRQLAAVAVEMERP